MSKSDRAFRALARAQPDVVVGLLRAVAPGLIPAGVAPSPDDVAPTQVDGLPPELDADWAARVTQGELLHMECQGYRDTGFSERLLWYLEPVVIEDLVRFGEDRGIEKGRLEGLREGLREGRREDWLEEERSVLRRVLAVRKLALDVKVDQRIDACTDLDTLRRWVDQAVLAPSAAEALQ